MRVVRSLYTCCINSNDNGRHTFELCGGGLQQIKLAKMFEEKVLQDERFEVHGTVTMGLVCFRLQVSSPLTLLGFGGDIIVCRPAR